MYSSFNPNKKIYSDLKLVARGALSEVYSCINQRLNIEVALKRLKPPFLYDQTEVEKIKREASILAKLDHPHCVKLISRCFSEKEIFLELEWIEGISLNERLKNGTLPEVEAKKLLQQLLQIVDDLQQKQIIHGDLQPKNILLTPKRVVLIDFSSSVETLPGQDFYPFHGTPRAYQMKLQMVQKQIHRYHDYQTLGLLFYEMLTGKKIFNAPDSLAHFLQTWNFDIHALPKGFPLSPQNAELFKQLMSCIQSGMQPKIVYQ